MANGISGSNTLIPKMETTAKMDPKFNGTLQNVTATVGRRATLSCTIENLGAHKVSTEYPLLSLKRTAVCAQARRHDKTAKSGVIKTKYILNPRRTASRVWEYGSENTVKPSASVKIVNFYNKTNGIKNANFVVSTYNYLLLLCHKKCILGYLTKPK